MKKEIAELETEIKRLRELLASAPKWSKAEIDITEALMFFGLYDDWLLEVEEVVGE